eukprot:gene34539-46347_t
MTLSGTPPDRTEVSRDPDALAQLQLTQALQRARYAIGWERLWPHLARLFSVVGLFLVVSWAGLWLALPFLARAVGLGLFGLLALASLFPLTKFRWPSREDGLARLDRGTGIRHRPATALTDTLATKDPVALALWQAGRAEDAFLLAKSALLASMYMGISPGNVGSMNYLDAYRRESQRDFADGAGVMSRAIVEGLFGIAPDALAGTLTVRPGFPAAWQRARMAHPDLGLDFARSGRTERWTVSQAAQPGQSPHPALRFRQLTLRIPKAYQRVQRVTVNGAPAKWQADRAAVAQPALLIQAPMARETAIAIEWAGQPVAAATAVAGVADAPAAAAASTQPPATDWRTDRTGATLEAVKLSPYFNDRVSDIFKPGKYQSPRSPF